MLNCITSKTAALWLSLINMIETYSELITWSCLLFFIDLKKNEINKQYSLTPSHPNFPLNIHVYGLAFLFRKETVVCIKCLESKFRLEWEKKIAYILKMLHLFLKVAVVSLLSHVWLFVTPWTIANRLLCPWNSSGKNTGVGSHSLL